MAESPDLPRYAHRMHAIYERFPVGSELTAAEAWALVQQEYPSNRPTSRVPLTAWSRTAS
jgi:hypothetical protein